jgi:phosphoglucosamine mutase
VIETGFVPAGDGIATALLTLEALGDADLAQRNAMAKLPQRLINVRVRDRDAIENADSLWQAVAQESRQLEGNGRVLVRASGTEPLLRVMVEAPGQDQAHEIAQRLADLARAELG